MKKKDSWRRRRHSIITTALRPVLRLYTRWKYGLRAEKFVDQGKRPYLILMNHQTGFDQFFVSVTFNRPVYFLATEDIFSMGWISRLIRWLVAPIPINKESMDIQAIKTCIRVSREGGTICLAPEGNRTYHGKTVYMRPSIVPLIKKLGLPLALFRIEGGYGIQPRWSSVVRRGHMRSYVSRVIEPEEYSQMSNEELMELIRTGLDVDEAKVTDTYTHRKNAEYLERAIYTCPTCGFARLESKGDIITCQSCHRSVRHLPTKELEGVDHAFPHRFVADWYEWQNDFVNGTDLLSMTQTPVFTDTARLSLVHVYKRKQLLQKDAKICLYGDRITIDQRQIPFDRITGIAVLGKNKLGIHVDKEFLQLKGDPRFNALKYVNFCFRYKNMTTGGQDGEFLGL